LLDRADKIWNRACDPEWQPTRPGDRSLHDVLRFHGLIRNGGLGYALDCDFEAAARAADGFRFLGAVELAEVIDAAHYVASRVANEAQDVDILDFTDHEVAQIEALGEKYDASLPTDDALDEVFRTYLAKHPEDFQPI
jgi:hypothetical protein